jgi:hypothetical protein
MVLAWISVGAGSASLAATTLGHSDFSTAVLLFGALGAMLSGGVSLVAAAVVARRAGITRTVVTMFVAGVGCELGFIAPDHQRICCSSPIATAIGSLYEINSAQSTYSSVCATGGYAVDLADLATPPGPGQAAFVSPDLTYNGVIKQGYRLSLVRDAAAGVVDVGTADGTCNKAGHQPVSSYFASASPIDPHVNPRYFATDAHGTIYESVAGPIRNPITPGPTVRPIH